MNGYIFTVYIIYMIDETIYKSHVFLMNDCNIFTVSIFPLIQCFRSTISRTIVNYDKMHFRS
ncbi:hypothetical protein A5892_13750 [Halotalea alkalilenta]|uniref:Uncharacterized protein n=1 Tax=Halotalea alkalilenta TaxID=376489 RepID=A0A172YH38_9GAMM|nr:hypothetical protein A5892_13750 [Halotalea alkalilenta]